jgi:hypothetical protein
MPQSDNISGVSVYLDRLAATGGEEKRPLKQDNKIEIYP